MAVVRRIRKRGASIIVESHAEILLMPGGQVHNWTNRFTGQIRSKTIRAAPVNTRPRWGHYGEPLKNTIVSARPRFWGNGRDKQRVYAAVGSTAPYATYVDQGTGIYAGSGPYPAKVLPPWSRGDASLYEHTWRPGGPGTRKVAAVMIRGQKGQFFFDKALREAFRHMRLRSFQVPGEHRVDNVLDSVVDGMLTGQGNTPNTPAFRQSLEEWRRWRDDAFEAGESLNRSRYNSAAVAKAAAARQSAKKKHGLPKKQQEALNAEIKRQNAATERRKAEAIRKRQEAKDRERAKSLILAKKNAEKAEREAAEEERKREEIRSRITARLKREAADLARKYANSGYTGVRLRTDFNKNRTQIVGFTVFYTSPSGATDSTKFR